MKSSKLWVKAIENFRENGLYGDHNFFHTMEQKCSSYKFRKCKVTTEVQIVIFL